MNCRACNFEHDPRMLCGVARRLRESVAEKQESHPQANIVQVGEHRNHPVTVTVTTCNQCAEKDREIERLRNQLKNGADIAPKRDRAKYMREYRSTKAGAAP